ncbi:hypothetical protein [Pyrobaculum neutrophilum]|uniref:Uncharacterized protein n=1 Tax=Pyrobaculum neutrophilum (strain DSM 2338 / JCM 9278 / NBRC 100436 / V24Sta) TaxID=444157 RepID=B1YCK2_PYRNV|nr:hypothetical protein [Pyrobaculum neutrophilum]ACB39515.1 hypothetical protein Tneu_0573 [Pyrobaculum neutrophilum V24Sta]
MHEFKTGLAYLLLTRAVVEGEVPEECGRADPLALLPVHAGATRFAYAWARIAASTHKYLRDRGAGVLAFTTALIAEYVEWLDELMPELREAVKHLDAELSSAIWLQEGGAGNTCRWFFGGVRRGMQEPKPLPRRRQL